MKYIEPDWPAPPTVRALCTTRLGGLSESPFSSMNLATHVGDEPERVLANRQRLVEAQQLPTAPIWLDQQHGCELVCIDNGETPSTAADAAYARQPERLCAVMTADCLPVLLCAADGSVVAAIHAGWRGLAAGIIEATVARLSSNQLKFYAWMGPAIGPAAYEIDRSVRSRLLATDPDAQDAFESTREGHWTADLYALARRRLIKAGVSDVFGGGLCTFSDSERFYSYRRDGACGRMASLIWRTA